MLNGPLVFVDTDTQRDFLEPDGALFIAGSEAILANLAQLTAFARRHGIPILASACAHTLDEPDPEPFPPHCLVGTRGQERVEATAWPGGMVVSLDAHGPDTIVPHLTIEKRRYDVFSHPDADRIFARYAQSDPTFVVYGVATDYCVRADVHGLLDRGYKVAVVVDAIRPVDPSSEAEVLTEFTRRGALLTLTEVVCSSA
ncbi:MAG TPA: isochorismatase family protein [Isosphaeraceae bacterium]|jgi:nicotinamidase/pyrazinamidase|nr:isochorismatase family protein [Isosphaeraceae bacterium]